MAQYFPGSFFVPNPEIVPPETRLGAIQQTKTAGNFSETSAGRVTIKKGYA